MSLRHPHMTLRRLLGEDSFLRSYAILSSSDAQISFEIGSSATSLEERTLEQQGFVLATSVPLRLSADLSSQFSYDTGNIFVLMPEKALPSSSSNYSKIAKIILPALYLPSHRDISPKETKMDSYQEGGFFTS